LWWVPVTRAAAGDGDDGVSLLEGVTVVWGSFYTYPDDAIGCLSS